MAISDYFDESIPLTDQSIYVLETNPDAIVWDLTTKIYRQSGHKVELRMVRDIVISRILPMKSLLAAKKERIAEENRLLAEERARQQQLADERARIAEEEARRQQQLAAEKEEEARKRFIADLEEKFGVKISDEIAEKRHSYMQEVFDRVKKVTIEQLEVDEDRVTPEANFANNLGADESDLLDLLISLEDEFDVEFDTHSRPSGGRWDDRSHSVVYDEYSTTLVVEYRLFGQIIERNLCEFTVDEFVELIFVKLYECAK